MPFVGGMRRVSPEMDVKGAEEADHRREEGTRRSSRRGEVHHRPPRQLPPGTGAAAGSYASETNAASSWALQHRSLLDHPPGFRPFRGTDLFERIGGQPTIDRLVDLLYEGIGDDDQLRPLFPRDLADGRSMQKLFFAEWLGGPRRYSEQAHAGLRHRHDGLPITPALASRWLGHFRRAMEATVAAEDDRRAIFAQVRSLALALVSGQVAPATPRGGGSGLAGRTLAEANRGTTHGQWPGAASAPVAWRGRRDLAHRGDVAGLGAALAEAPDLLRPTYAAAIMQAAVLAGRAEIVQMLLDRGVGADHPFYLPVSVTGVAFERVVFVTPLCAARMKRRSAVESLLLAAGANEDVFTSAFLGDLTSLARMLAADPGLAQATDPAVDVLDITPVEHAVAGGQAAALRLILDHVAHPLPAMCTGVARCCRTGQPGDGRAAAGTRGGRDTDRRRTLGPASRARSAACQPWRGDRLLRLVDRCQLHGKPGPQGRSGLRPRAAAPRCPRERSPGRRPGRSDRRPGSQRDSACTTPPGQAS